MNQQEKKKKHIHFLTLEKKETYLFAFLKNKDFEGCLAQGLE